VARVKADSALVSKYIKAIGVLITGFSSWGDPLIFIQGRFEVPIA